MNRLFLPAFALIVSVFFASCGSNGGNEDALNGEVRVDGSSTVYPITEAIAEEFTREFPKVKVTVGLSGTGGGFKKLCRGEIDVNNASRTIGDAEQSACAEAGVEYLELSVAYDGLSVVVNPENNWLDTITVRELKMIWEPAAQGKITHWNQIRPEWPAEEIHLYGAGVESGTYDYFTEAVVGESHSSRGDYTASEDDNVLVHGISTDRLALGFFGYAYYEQNADKLKLVAVDDENPDNGDGGIYPSVETVKNNTYAPLSRALYIYVNSKSAQQEAVQTFVDFYLNNSAVLSEEVGFIPMAEETYTGEKEKFRNFVTRTSGTAQE